MFQLPDELTTCIIGFLDVHSLGRICVTNRRLRRTACSSAVWQPLVLALDKPASVIATARAACPPLNKGWRAVYRELLHLEATDHCWRCAKAAASARDKYEKATTEVKAENVRLRRYLGAHGIRVGVEQWRVRATQELLRDAEARQQEAEAEYRHAEAALLRARRKREQYARPFQV